MLPNGIGVSVIHHLGFKSGFGELGPGRYGKTFYTRVGWSEKGRHCLVVSLHL